MIIFKNKQIKYSLRFCVGLKVINHKVFTKSRKKLIKS